NHESYAAWAPILDSTWCGPWLYRSKNACAAWSRGLAGVKARTVGDLAAELPPPHLHGVQPGAVGRQVQHDKPAGRRAHARFDLLIGMGIGVIPSDRAGAGGVAVDPGLQPVGDRASTLPTSAQHHGVARLLGDGTQAIPLVRLPWGRTHDWLPPRAPQRTPG